VQSVVKTRYLTTEKRSITQRITEGFYLTLRSLCLLSVRSVVRNTIFNHREKEYYTENHRGFPQTQKGKLILNSSISCKICIQLCGLCAFSLCARW